MRTLLIGLVLLGLSPLPHCAAEKADKEPTLIVFGRVVWPGLAWFPGGAVAAARDLKFRDTVATAPLSPEGRFVLALPSGEYYLRAVVDLDADGKLGPGDGVGFYGVRTAADRPRRLDVRPEAAMDTAVVPVAFQIGQDHRLHRAAVGAVAGCGRVVGRLASENERTFIVLWPAGSRYAGYAVPVGDDGRFEARVAAGVYSLGVVAVAADGAKVIRALQAAGASGGTVRVLPQRTVDLGEVKAKAEAEGSGQGDDEASGFALPEGLGLARLEIAAGGPDAQAWQVMLFANEQLGGLMLKAWLWRGVWLALRPATYYVLCGSDANGDGVLGPGDVLATARGQGRIGFVSVRPGEVVKAAVDRVAEISGHTTRPENGGQAQDSRQGAPKPEGQAKQEKQQ